MVEALGLKAGQLRDWGTKPGPVICGFNQKYRLILYIYIIYIYISYYIYIYYILYILYILYYIYILAVSYVSSYISAPPEKYIRRTSPHDAILPALF